MKSWSSMSDAEKLGLISAVVVVIGEALALLSILVANQEDDNDNGNSNGNGNGNGNGKGNGNGSGNSIKRSKRNVNQASNVRNISYSYNGRRGNIR